MHKRLLCLSFALLGLAGCGGTTIVEVEAASLDGATVSYVGSRTEGFLLRPMELGTLNAAGRGLFHAPMLETDEIELRFERDGLSASAPAICLPPMVREDQNIDRARFLLRRARATGACFLIALEVEQNGTTTTGSYDPELFDDAPCGPWAAPTTL